MPPGLDLHTAYTFDRNHIVDIILEIGLSTQAYGVHPQYVLDSSVTQHCDGIKVVTETIASLVTARTAFDPKAAKHLRFGDTVLYGMTVFDLLGWVLSVATNFARTVDGASVRNATNYYLPLVAVYAKWCLQLSNSQREWPQMAHIAWFPAVRSTSATPADRVADTPSLIIGSTPGVAIFDSVQYRSFHAVRIRQDSMLQAGYVAPPNQQIVDTAGEEPGGNFGVCAETFLFLYLKMTKQKIGKDKIRGFALAPPELASVQAYDDGDAEWALRAPCAKSCQRLLKQLDPTWNWWESFPIDLRPPWRDDYSAAFFEDGRNAAPPPAGAQHGMNHGTTAGTQPSPSFTQHMQSGAVGFLGTLAAQSFQAQSAPQHP